MRFRLTATNRRRLDLFEQVAVFVLFGWLIIRLLPGAIATGGVLPIVLLLISEGIVCVLLVFRRPTSDISQNLMDWVIAAAGSFLPLMVVNNGGDVALGLLGPYLMILGMLVHTTAKLNLLRSFGLVAANRGIKVGGLYAYVRHPMYAGYMLTHIGFMMASPSLWNAVIYAAVWTLLVARMLAEERVLSADADYRKYARLVRHRIVPGFY